ncbi:MAG: argininosuccinate synthase [bacterium]|nr:argininosuccinate synthase [bacterium]
MKIVLAYSGGLDTSVILKWLINNYKAEVIAFVADIGQPENLRKVQKKALDTGASKVYVEDLKEEFVRDFVFPMFRANAIYEGMYLLGTSIARPLIAKGQVAVARREKADTVSHGATGKGNDQVRFELTYAALAPDLKVIAPWREWELRSRSDMIRYAKENGIPVTATKQKPYSIDQNMLHTSYEGGILEDPWSEPPSDMFLTTVSPEQAPDRPAQITVEFEKGTPVAVNSRKYTPARLLMKLNQIGAQNGVGRVDVVEDRFVGMKSRGVYETPGGTILHVAHRAMESITMDREVMHIRDSLIPKFSQLIYNGFWFSPEMDVLRALVEETQKDVTGTVRLKVYKGNVTVTGRKSPLSLYREDVVTFEADKVYDQSKATGFIDLNALRLRIRARRGRR